MNKYGVYLQIICLITGLTGVISYYGIYYFFKRRGEVTENSFFTIKFFSYLVKYIKITKTINGRHGIYTKLFVSFVLMSIVLIGFVGQVILISRPKYLANPCEAMIVFKGKPIQIYSQPNSIVKAIIINDCKSNLIRVVNDDNGGMWGYVRIENQNCSFSNIKYPIRGWIKMNNLSYEQCNLPL